MLAGPPANRPRSMLAARFHYVGDWGTRPMAYRHKLSRRLALLRDLAALAAPTLVGAACERTASLPTTAAPTVAQIVVVPESLTLDPSQQSKFAAYGRLSNGDSAAVAVVWSATGGAIRSDGTYIADTTPGDFQVTATSAPLRLSGSARVRIRPRPAVASVTVAPASATLAVGQTVQLTATPRDSSGAPLVGRSVTWSSGNPAVATVSAAGLVTAAGAGATTITATSEGRSGTASVTVAASSGATVLFQETFEDLAFASRGWYDNTAMTITDTEHIAGSTHALEVHFQSVRAARDVLRVGDRHGGVVVPAPRREREVLERFLKEHGCARRRGDGDARRPAPPLARGRDRGRAGARRGDETRRAHRGDRGIAAAPGHRPPDERGAARVAGRGGELHGLAHGEGGRCRRDRDRGDGRPGPDPDPRGPREPQRRARCGDLKVARRRIGDIRAVRADRSAGRGPDDRYGRRVAVRQSAVRGEFALLGRVEREAFGDDDNLGDGGRCGRGKRGGPLAGGPDQGRGRERGQVPQQRQAAG